MAYYPILKHLFSSGELFYRYLHRKNKIFFYKLRAIYVLDFVEDYLFRFFLKHKYINYFKLDKKSKCFLFFFLINKDLAENNYLNIFLISFIKYEFNYQSI